EFVLAGNTTTNRIELNWNQLKILFSLKTRIDQTIAGLLQRQMTITHQIVLEIGRLHASSRRPKMVLIFLRAVGSRISAHVLKNLKGEWNQFVNLMETTTCETVSLTTGKLSCLHQSFKCHDLDWKYTCLFSTSKHLPCCHIMPLAHKGHGFKMLLSMTIRERWSTLASLNSMEGLAAAGGMLRSIVHMSKRRLPKLKLPDESSTRKLQYLHHSRNKSCMSVCAAVNVQTKLFSFLLRSIHSRRQWWSLCWTIFRV
ncbi:hypothetical protein PHMEG_00022472, partial [Phytophthora megakarya]